MPVVRVKKTKDFTCIQNSIVRNSDLSGLEKSVLNIALSLPDDWDFSIKGIAHFCKEGRDAVQTAANGLEEKGYLLRERQRKNGRFGKLKYTFFEDSSLNEKYCAQRKTEPVLTAENDSVPAVQEENFRFQTEAESGEEKASAVPVTLSYSCNPYTDTPDTADPDASFPEEINTDLFNTNINNTLHINPSIYQKDIEERIKQQIEYTIMSEEFDHHHLNDLVAVIVNVMVSQSEVIHVSQDNTLPTQYVKKRLALLNPLHVEQVMRSLERSNPIIRNARGYLLTALINAVDTMDIAYQYGDY